MILEKVLWTALPNHFDKNKRLRISLHVAPRIVNDDGSSTHGKLGGCPAFHEWPKRLATLKFKVEFDNGVTAQGVPEQQGDSALWSRLFPADTSASAVRVPEPRQALPARLSGAWSAQVRAAGVRRSRRPRHRPSVDRRPLRTAGAFRAA